MLFDLPFEILSIIVGFLNPDCILRLQTLTRINVLELYRHGKGYAIAESERIAFEQFRDKYFMLYLYSVSMRVPRSYTQSLIEFRPTTNRPNPALLDMIRVRGITPAGRLVVSIFKHEVGNRTNTTWPIFLTMAVNAMRGKIGQLSDLKEEKELAIALVQYGRFHFVGVILRGYVPQTEHMIKTMLHFSVRIPLEKLVDSPLLTQELCDYWFCRGPCDSQIWLVNNIPCWISIERMLIVNAGRFMALAKKKTLERFRIVEERKEWTEKSMTFFPALLRCRKKIGVAIADLDELNELHIRLHGRIDHLLSSNRIIQRSRIFKPGMDVLMAGALHRDQLFSIFLDRIPFITRQDKTTLRALVEPSIARPSPPLPGYIFFAEEKVKLLDFSSLLQAAYSSGEVVLETEV